LTLLSVNVGAVLLILGVFEAALRLWTPVWLAERMTFLAAGGRVEAIGSDRSWSTIKKNDRFISFVPHEEFDVVHTEYCNRVFIDELGGRKLSLQRMTDKLLPCIGDSFTFGVGVNNGETFIDLLQSSFRFRLLNLGVPGSAFPEQRLLLESRHSELGHPDLYLQFFFLGNDFADIVDTEAHAEGILQQWLREVNAYVSKGSLRHVYSLQFAKRAIMQATQDKRKNPIFDMMSSKSELYHQRVRVALRAELEAWKTLSQKHNFRMLVVFVPDLYQVNSGRRARQAAYYGMRLSDLDPLLPNRILTESLLDYGFSFIDPTQDFAAMLDVDELYYVNDNHFTAKGHMRFAETIRQRLIEAISDQY
jgi:hypothetical protein